MNQERCIQLFYELSNIPRSSGEEQQISDFVVDFVKNLGYSFRRDHVNNIIVEKPASKGMETQETVALQSHLDMICVKNPDSRHDFSKDALVLVEENGWITAKDTSLGADNGIGMAFMLALLEDKKAIHPPLELIFTTDEERGLEGVSAIDVSDLKATKLINLDGEEEGVFFVSCAGGVRTVCTLPLVEQPWESGGQECLEITISGGLGGHSGLEIHKERSNAIVALARLLYHLKKQVSYQLHAIEGGEKENSIPTSGRAIISYDKKEKAQVESILAEFQKSFKQEYVEDSMVVFEMKPIEKDDFPSRVYDETTAKSILQLLLLLPNGPMRKNLQTGDVILSANVGVIEVIKSDMVVTSLIRSNSNSAKEGLKDVTEVIAEKMGVLLLMRGDYPAWEYAPRSVLRDQMSMLYQAEYHKAPQMQSVHAGLECAYFAKKRPDWDMISMGCNILQAHSTQERLEIASAIRTYEFLKIILQSM